MIQVKHSPASMEKLVAGMTRAVDAVLQEEATILTYIRTRKDAYMKGLLKSPLLQITRVAHYLERKLLRPIFREKEYKQYKHQCCFLQDTEDF